MFTQIRKHQKTLWIFISSMVIISFVWYFNPNQRASRRGGGGGPGGDDRVGMINGEPIHRAEYVDAYREAVLHYLFTYGDWPKDNEMNRQMRPVERETRNRVFLTHKIKELNIQVDDKAVVDWIATAFQDRETKQYHHEYYQRFIQNIQQNRMKETDFQRYARHQVAIQHLAAVAGASGKLVTPQEAEQTYREEHEKADTKVALFSLSNYVANVEVTDDAIAKFYTNRASAYRLPERLQLSYVEFPATNYLAKADERLATETNLNQRIDAVYLQRGPSFYTDPSGQPLTADAAKARIREDMRKEVALSESRKDAFAFANALADVTAKTNVVNVANPAEALESLAAAKGLKTEVTEPFTQMQGPRSLNLPEQFSRMAFRLTPDEPIVSEPVQGEDAYYVVSYKQKIPSELPALDTIKERVITDFKRAESMKLTRDAANAFLNSVTNSPNKGEEFAKLATQNGVSFVDLTPFSRDSRSNIEGLPLQVNPSSLRSTVFELGEGQTSNYMPGSDGGYVIYVEKFLPAADDEVKKELPAFLDELRRRNASEAFNDWFAHEAQLAKLQLPGDKGSLASAEEE
jgi:hypothetical protein